MNNRQNGRRRGRGGQQVRNGQPGGQDRGNRIDNRARGNAAQLLEKYKSLARDAQMQGDRVNTEYYLQFADHYFRVLSESRARFEEQRPRRDDDRDDDYEMGDEESFAVPVVAERPARNGHAERWTGDDEQAAPASMDAEAPRRAAPPSEDRQRPEGGRAEGARGDGPRGEGERRPRRPRERAARPVANDLVDMADGAPARIEADRLPGALSVQPAPMPVIDAADAPVAANGDGAGEEAPRPRRRAPRRPRAESPAVEA